ncbi:hypothetical protein SAMN06265365_106175 [Tistlia consotensis]|uniref:Uncharacterized protein n=1 Tax=Tistlia consotensis USBA 355 TaxID=560819 RepID=A0A1Y6BCS5_9PROT|nr:hypothetical protein [Tistlia consotensis]SMF04785.1 hypothetical protein SAMN05428998_103226 [Tistlia consotensis USBA 355]SNR54793.1 hypothetical protein SAMN06265365_106175 [Tistlia consotensis]
MNPRPNKPDRNASGRAVAADRQRQLLNAGLINAGLVTGSLLLGATAIALWVTMVF